MIYLDFDGKPTPANELLWLALDPCGCASGAVAVWGIDSPFAITAEQARRAQWGTKREADMDKRTYELAHRNTLRDRMPIPCPHKEERHDDPR